MVGSAAAGGNGNKKRKAKSTAAANSSTRANNKKSASSSSSSGNISAARAALHAEIGYQPVSLQDIHDRIVELCRRVPPVPESGFALLEDEAAPQESTQPRTIPVASTPCPYDKAQIRAWAAALQTVLEEFHLIVALVSAATYRWGTDRSGAADQNLGLLSNELARSQEQILGRVSPRINDVLAPVVSLLTDKTVTTKTADAEIKQNYFIQVHEDPDYVHLCYAAAARNAVTMRQVVLANFDKLLQSLQDYLQAQTNDSQHDARGFVY